MAGKGASASFTTKIHPTRKLHVATLQAQILQSGLIPTLSQPPRGQKDVRPTDTSQRPQKRPKRHNNLFSAVVYTKSVPEPTRCVDDA